MTFKMKIMVHVGVIKIRGHIMSDEETSAILCTVHRLIEDNIHRIVVDLSRVKWINSVGIGMLMACYSAVHDAEGKIALVKIPDKVLEILSITRVHTLFDQFGSIREAVKAYR